LRHDDANCRDDTRSRRESGRGSETAPQHHSTRDSVVGLTNAGGAVVAPWWRNRASDEQVFGRHPEMLEKYASSCMQDILMAFFPHAASTSALYASAGSERDDTITVACLTRSQDHTTDPTTPAEHRLLCTPCRLYESARLAATSLLVDPKTHQTHPVWRIADQSPTRREDRAAVETEFHPTSSASPSRALRDSLSW
jgi:hypothetical protein